MKKFTLWTEANSGLQELAREHFHSFTIQPGSGVYLGALAVESAAIIIFAEDQTEAARVATLKKVHALADSIKLYNNQYNVLVTEEDVTGYLV